MLSITTEYMAIHAVPSACYKKIDLFDLIWIYKTIVNGGKWLGRLVNIKEADKQSTIYVGRSLTLHIFCLMLINYA